MLGVNPLADHSTYQCVYYGRLYFATCDDVTGKEPRLWNCPPAAATESYIQDTTGLLETPLASPTRGPEE
jgi:hypothetical protein